MLRDKLIEAGVGNLQAYGYPKCTAGNILTDEVYSAFFLSMLKENKGASKRFDEAIDQLIAEIKNKEVK